MAAITQLASSVNAEPGIGIGVARPLASAAPSAMRTQVTLSRPPAVRSRLAGATSVSTVTPSASAASTSAMRHGISRRDLR